MAGESRRLDPETHRPYGEKRKDSENQALSQAAECSPPNFIHAVSSLCLLAASLLAGSHRETNSVAGSRSPEQWRKETLRRLTTPSKEQEYRNHFHV